MKYTLFIQALLLGVYFWMNDSQSAALMTFVIAPLNLLSAFKRVKTLYPMFAVVVLFAGMIGYDSARDLFPIAAVCISLFALFNLNGVKMRGVLMICSMLWIIHDVSYGMPIILFMDVLILALNILGTVRIIREVEGTKSSAATLIGTRGLGGMTIK